MPGPLLISGVQAAGNILDAGIQMLQNKANRKWELSMYNRQRGDALADWNMQNEYNSPLQQMARLKQAGLNPNLVYGGNAVGNAGGSVRAATGGSTRGIAPTFDAGSVMNSYVDTQVRNAQVDLLETNNAVKQQEAINKAIDALLKGNKLKHGEFDLELKNTLRNNTIELAQAELRKRDSQTSFNIDENTRRMIMMEPNMQIAAEKILNYQAARAKTFAEKSKIYSEIDNLKRDGTLKDLEINLRKQGLTSKDPAWQRALIQLLSKFDIGTATDQQAADYWKKRLLGN